MLGKSPAGLPACCEGAVHLTGLAEAGVWAASNSSLVAS